MAPLWRTTSPAPTTSRSYAAAFEPSGKIHPSPPPLAGGTNYTQAIPHSATVYKGHYVLIGRRTQGYIQGSSHGMFLVVYDEKLKPLFGPWEVPIAKPPANLYGMQVFGHKDELLIVYDHSMTSVTVRDVHVMRLRIDGLP